MIRGITKQLLTAITVAASALAVAPAMAKTAQPQDPIILRAPEINDGTAQIRRVRMATPKGQAAYLQGLADGLKSPRQALRQARQRGGYYGEGVTFARELRSGEAHLSPFAAGWMSGALQSRGVQVSKSLLGENAGRSAVFQAGVREGITLARQTAGLNPRGGELGTNANGAGGVQTGNTPGSTGTVISPSGGVGNTAGGGVSSNPRGGPVVPNLGNTAGGNGTTSTPNTNTGGGVSTGSNPIGSDASAGTIPGQPTRGGGLNPNPAGGNGGNGGNNGGNNGGGTTTTSSSSGKSDRDEVGDRFGSGLGGVIDIMSGIITVAGGLSALTAEDGSFMGKLFGGLQVASGLLGGIGGLNKLYGAFSGNYFLPDGFRKIAGYASMLNTGLALFGAFKGALGDIGGIFGGGDDDEKETKGKETPGKIVRDPTAVHDGSVAAGSQPQVVYVPAGAGGGGGTPVAARPGTTLDNAAATGQALNGLYLLNCPTGGSCYLVPVEAKYGEGLQPPAPQVAAGVDAANGVGGGGAADAANAAIAEVAGQPSGKPDAEIAKAAEESCLGYIEAKLRKGGKSIDDAAYWRTLCSKINLPGGIDADRAKELGEMFATEAEKLGRAYFTGCASQVGIDKFGEACGGTAADGVPYWVHARTPMEAHQWGRQQAEYYKDTILLNNAVATNDSQPGKAGSEDVTVPTRDRVDTDEVITNPAAGEKGDGVVTEPKADTEDGGQIDAETPGTPEAPPTVEGDLSGEDV